MSRLLLVVAVIAALMLCTAPVLSGPLTWEDVTRLSGRQSTIAPVSSDAMVYRHGRGWRVVWPFYTATFRGDTLTTRLLGSQTEVALQRLGYHDDSPYDLSVTTVTIDVDGRGRPLGLARVSRPMDKGDFDHRYAWYIDPDRLPFTLTLPTPPPQ